MSEAPKAYSSIFQAGRMEEFMRHTKDDVQAIKLNLNELHKESRQLREAMLQHSQQATNTAEDIGEVKASMVELHQCVSKLHTHKADSKGKWKHIGIGALVTIGILSFVVAVAAGKDGDILTTMARVLGVLI